ncbi:low temperature requirement protein A [Microbacterium sp. M3]|uniref:Low temperature requirement protein A n=1 Tax=Microbacterium arthrosphaerae TaxID=792652 RepID=A0ABU4H1I3_9MICO|nr:MULTISPECIES: low temperature requirement protein A [Microbacterium]MDW4573186.1 low temperature requirement protein A [Microbacterium arthrosphaerae]MDW7607041.1 low temperature requirement protein A [Microbacterium sp. M3]
MSLSHHLGRMTGRDPNEAHRAATPLELLFDLTFVVAFSQISSQTAHLLELGHVSSALIGFAFATFAVTWAWINYSWLASAYDNDDVFFRLSTLVVMIGVLIVALGVPDVFHSIEEGHYLDNTVMVAGYVVMRIATIALWVRAALHDEARRKTCIAYIVNVSIAQVGWIALIFLNMPVGITMACAVTLILFELAGPLFAEKRFGPTPWHPHHIAERYGLLVIITLGEVILGTILAISAVVQAAGWSLEAGLVAFGGTALAFGMWWNYFVLPFGEVLERHRWRGFPWGYLHLFVFGALIAVGAGLHVAANVIAHVAHVDATFAVLSIAIPVLVYETFLFGIYALTVMQFDPFHLWLYLGSVAALVASVIAVSLGASLGVALLFIACAPAIVVVGYETVGWRHGAAMLERARET